MSYEEDIDKLLEFVIERIGLKREIIRLERMIEGAHAEGYDTGYANGSNAVYDLSDAWDQSRAKRDLTIDPYTNQVTL
jgi:hypothetical protein